MSIDCEQQPPTIPDSDDEPPGEPTPNTPNKGSLTTTLPSLHPPSNPQSRISKEASPSKKARQNKQQHPPSGPTLTQSLPILDFHDRNTHSCSTTLDPSCSSSSPALEALPAFDALPEVDVASVLSASRTSDVLPSPADAGLPHARLKTDLFGHPLDEHRGPSRNGKAARRVKANPTKPISSKAAPEKGLIPEEAPTVRPVKRLVEDGTGTARKARGNPRTKAFRKAFFPDVTDRDWNDWRWQSRHRVRNLQQLEKMLVLSDDEREALNKAESMLPVGITPYYMSLLDRHDASQPLRRTVIPATGEFKRTAGEADDPLGEDGHSPVPGLVHRYPDRVLLLALDFCSTYCRYCTRSRVVGHGEIAPKEERLQKIFEYLRRTPAVRDVLISGGDPLAMAEDKIDYILRNLRAIPHIEFVRIGTKMPAVLPQRVTPQLTRVLRKYHPLWMSVHFLHGDECTPESNQACSRLADAGIPLGAQTVLLKGVNDDVGVMKDLVHKLLLQRVRPYYLYQCDPISGSSHFRTSVSKGLEIIEGLRGHTTGYAVPTYVIDAPGGGGKIPLQPNYVVGRDGDNVVLRNFEGKEYRYPDPVTPDALPAEAMRAPTF